MPVTRQVTVLFEEHAKMVKDALSQAFQLTGYDDVFLQFCDDFSYDRMSQRVFSTENFLMIDAYYQQLLTPLSINDFLSRHEQSGAHRMTPSQKEILLTAGRMFHRLARMQAVMLRLETLGDARECAQDCDDYVLRLNHMAELNNKNVNQRARTYVHHVKNYLHDVGTRLYDIGYLNDMPQYVDKKNHDRVLTLTLSNTFSSLPTKKMLFNEISRSLTAEPQTVSNEQKATTCSYLKSALVGIAKATDLFKVETAHHFTKYDLYVAELEQKIAIMDTHFASMPLEHPIHNLKHLYQAFADIDPGVCESLETAMLNLDQACRHNYSQLNQGSPTDVWFTANKTIAIATSRLSQRTKSIFDCYVQRIDLAYDKTIQHAELKTQHTRLTEIVSVMKAVRTEAEEVCRVYMQAIIDAKVAVQHYLKELENNSFNGIISRYLPVAAGGGLSGAFVMGLAGLATTNPITLTLLVAAGGLLAAAGAVSSDAIGSNIQSNVQRQHQSSKKLLPAPPNMQSSVAGYGSLMHQPSRPAGVVNSHAGEFAASVVTLAKNLKPW